MSFSCRDTIPTERAKSTERNFPLKRAGEDLKEAGLEEAGEGAVMLLSPLSENAMDAAMKVLQEIGKKLVKIQWM
jgi:hypothetical protein